MSYIAAHKTHNEVRAPLRKVRKFYQVSLPTKLSRKFGIAEGDYVEMEEVKSGILVKPVSVAARVSAVRLTSEEQRLLKKATDKVVKLNLALTSAKGLTKDEALVAAKAGLIDSAQIWWWLESWQKREREAEEDIRAGKASDSFKNVEALMRHLRS